MKLKDINLLIEEARASGFNVESRTSMQAFIFRVTPTGKKRPLLAVYENGTVLRQDIPCDIQSPIRKLEDARKVLSLR